MTIRLDPRERRPEILALGPHDKLLEYRDESNPTAAYSYDALVEWHGGSLKVEIKQWSDHLASMFEGKLPRQAAAVDVYICERDPFTSTAGMPNGPGQAAWLRQQEAGEKRLISMALAMPVIRTRNVEETIMALRHIEASEGGTIVRPNRIKAPDGSPRMALLASLPRVNPSRPYLNSTVGAHIWASFVDAPALCAALGLDRWGEIPAFGAKTLQGIRKALCGDEAP